MTIALGALLLFGVAAFGAVGVWESAVYQAAALLLYAWGRRLERPPMVALAWLGVAAWGCVQVWMGWTVFRPVTEAWILRAAAFGALGICAARVFRVDRERRRLLAGFLVAGGAIATLGLVQAATTKQIYWMFPVRAGSPFGPFVNRDHFAILMEILLPVALWEAVRKGGSGWIGCGLATLFFAGTVATGSRAGAGIALLEILVLGPVAWRVSRGTDAFPWSIAAGAAVLVCGAAGVAGWEALSAKFADRDPLRVRREIAQAAVELIGERPWTGHGLGTFESVYPSRAVFEANARIDHAHNDWLELAVESGLPAAGLVWAAVMVSLWRARQSPWAWGALAALVHSLVDFPMQIPGLAGLIVAVMAGGETGRRTQRTDSP